MLLIDGGLVTGAESLFTSRGHAGVTVLELGTECDDIADLRLVVDGGNLAVRSDVRRGGILRGPTR